MSEPAQTLRTSRDRDPPEFQLENRMHIQKPGLLDRVPLDIITYLVEKIIDDGNSLLMLSKTSRILRELVLPRLRSHTVRLDITKCLAGIVREPALDPAYKTILDFLSELKSYKLTFVRVLELRDTIPEVHPKYAFGPLAHRFARTFYEFLAKCINLRKVLRDGYEYPSFKTVDLLTRLLAMPKLKILCLKIHQDEEWCFNETPVFEEYERPDVLEAADKREGIACLSIALPMTLKRRWWDETENRRGSGTVIAGRDEIEVFTLSHGV
ncbi:hypothetical protein ABW21_db0204123 [Orbilia brochopaga]|nr:hypothetical protein ABW21_db0204123 [Drechslerella brochopaga]